MLQDLGHRSSPHSVLLREFRDFPVAASSTATDVRHLFGSELRAAVSHPPVVGSALSDHVLHVLCVSPYEQMTRIDALRRVACMAHLKGLRNDSVQVFIQPAMSTGDTGSSWFKASV